MDCRKALVLGVLLAGGTSGCQLPSLAVAPPAPPTPRTAKKAPTFVCVGEMRLRAAQAPELAPAVRHQYHEEARLAFQKALEIDPKYVPAYALLAQLFTDQEDHTRAAVMLQKVVELDGGSAGAWYELYRCRARLKDWSAAAEAVRKALEHDPTNRRYANDLGFALALAGRHRECLETFERTVGKARAHYNLARLLQRDGQKELARQHTLLAINRDPALGVARALLVEIEEGRPPPTRMVDSALQPASYTVPAQPQYAAARSAPAPLPAVPVVLSNDAEVGTEARPIRIPPLPLVGHGEGR